MVKLWKNAVNLMMFQETLQLNGGGTLLLDFSKDFELVNVNEYILNNHLETFRSTATITQITCSLGRFTNELARIAWLLRVRIVAQYK